MPARARHLVVTGLALNGHNALVRQSGIQPILTSGGSHLAVLAFKLGTLGVDGIITDEPVLAKSITPQLAQLTATERLLIRASTTSATGRLSTKQFKQRG